MPDLKHLLLGEDGVQRTVYQRAACPRVCPRGLVASRAPVQRGRVQALWRALGASEITMR